ncbi:large ribosomal subunit protein uL10m isoform X2 [Chamaea fasciata]|uniref:large ribosomal subunit protein uL10m isoform X2 n=1 Tax=Chamaea fasciata TaxID=190680 RepID=UPI00336AD413
METGAREAAGPPPSHRPLRGRGQDGGAGRRRDAMAAGLAARPAAPPARLQGGDAALEGHALPAAEAAGADRVPAPAAGRAPALPAPRQPPGAPGEAPGAAFSCGIGRGWGAEEDGYARVLRRQAEQTLRDSRMVAVCHYNPMAEEDVATLRHYLRRHNIHLKFVLNEVMRPVLAQSRYRELLPLFVCRNVLLVSPEAPAREMLRVLKGVPQVTLLGACIDDTILSRQGVEKLARLPSLEASRGQTVAALSLLASQTSSLLQRAPAHLTALLDRHIRELRGAPEHPPGRGAGNH